MPTKWNKNLSEQEIDELLKDLKGANDIILNNDIILVITSAIDFDSEVVAPIANQIVHKALSNLTIRNLNRDNLMREIGNLMKAYLRQQRREFHVITDISISENATIDVINIDNISLHFVKRIGKKYKREDYTNNLKSVLHCSELPSNYKKVIIKLKSRSPIEAGFRATEALDFIRSTWNFYLNFKTGRQLHFKTVRSQPLNQIIPGPLYTIHETDGSISDRDVYYYEQAYLGPINPLNVSPLDWKKIKKFEQIVKRGISKNRNWGQRIKNAVVNYSRALDKYDHKNSFFELWGILEFLATINGRENSEKVIQRVANIYPETELQKCLLRYLRNIRNSIAHFSNKEFNMTNMMFNIKEYVEHLLHYHLGMLYRLENYYEAIEFLDLPSSKAQVERQIKIRQIWKLFNRK